MSIVLDALEKTQKQVENEKKTTKLQRKKPVDTEINKETVPDKPRFYYSKYLFFIVPVILSLGTVVVMFSFKPKAVIYEEQNTMEDELETTDENPEEELDDPITQKLVQETTQEIMLPLPEVPVNKFIDSQNEMVPVKFPAIQVSGIIWDETAPLTLINEKILKEGDIVKGARIEKIYVDKVEFSYKNRIFSIEVQK